MCEPTYELYNNVCRVTPSPVPQPKDSHIGVIVLIVLGVLALIGGGYAIFKW